MKRAYRNRGLMGSDYVSCRFKGRYIGVDFGRSPWPNPIDKKFDEYGELIDCDFTEATLDLCRFFSVDLARQKFAPWPQFVIPTSRYLAAFIQQRQWPGELGRFINLARSQDMAMSAITGTAKDFKKDFKIEVADLSQALDEIGGVIR